MIAIRKRNGGQTLVEFAIAVVLLALLLFGIIQYGFIFGAYITVRNASAVGARQAVIDTNQAETAARDALSPMLSKANPPATVALTQTNVAGVNAQSMTVTYDLPLIIPWVVIGSSTPTSVTLRATTVMR